MRADYPDLYISTCRTSSSFLNILPSLSFDSLLCSGRLRLIISRLHVSTSACACASIPALSSSSSIIIVTVIIRRFH